MDKKGLTKIYHNIRQQQEHQFEDFGGQTYYGFDEAASASFPQTSHHPGWSSSPSENDYGPNDNNNGGMLPTSNKKKRGKCCGQVFWQK